MIFFDTTETRNNSTVNDLLTIRIVNSLAKLHHKKLRDNTTQHANPSPAATP